MHTTKQKDDQPVCQCGARCWAYGENKEQPCWGSMHVSEDYPGEYTHYCDGHGHFEDAEPYKPNPQQGFENSA